jgi:flagellar biosynthetic protein FliR
LIIGGIAVAGQVTTGAIGLGQANMMDPSLGGQVAVLARAQSLVAGVIFLVIDGHHTVIRAAANTLGDIGIGMFRPNENVAMLIIERFAHTFEVAVSVSAPILVTVLVANFVLGLITRFVSQVNIFIISLPLTIIMGLYITVYTTTGLVDHLIVEFLSLEQVFEALTKLE